mmetsp:Transcript_41549/g.48448  ORF Transcript_41549/g.48448 Transcript_41549/m.48448 type:complete len:551 (+) Transcript_41549:51-1703(+)
MSSSAFQHCSKEGEDNISAVIQCVSDALETKNESLKNGLDAFYLIYATSLVFFMQAGFAMLCAGCVRAKNVQNSMLKNLLDACGAALGFWSVGYAFAYGGGLRDDDSYSFIGKTNFFMNGVEDEGFWLFQFAFAATSATIVAGTLAERCQMSAYLTYSYVLTGFVYPVIVRSMWSRHGFLSPLAEEKFGGVGAIDFAGSGVVHMTGGTTAFMASYILGARRGRFEDHLGNTLKKPKAFPGHSDSLQFLGVFILWFAWYGFNAGSALTISSDVGGKIAARAAVNTTLSAAAGCVSALFINVIYTERRNGEAVFNSMYARNGCLGGLVAITAGCGVVDHWAAVFIGSVAGLIYLLSSEFLLRIHVDDVVDAIPVHFSCGVWGLLSVGLFAVPDFMDQHYGSSDHVGLFYSGDATLLGVQIVAGMFIIAWSLVIMCPFFLILHYVGWLRADSLEEMVGLDVSYHGRTSDGDEKPNIEYIEAMRLQKKKNKNTARVADNQFELTDAVRDERINGTISVQDIINISAQEEIINDFDSVERRDALDQREEMINSKP